MNSMLSGLRSVGTSGTPLSLRCPLRTVLRPLVGALLVLAVALPPASAQNATTGTLRGRVLNLGTNRYLNNAQVSVEGTNLQTHTDEYGQYVLGGVPAGEVTVHVVYTGLDTATQTATVAPGSTTSLDFKVTNKQRYGDKDTVVLDPFVVQSAREFEGASLATNEQRYSPNIKVVMAADAFGDVTEGNAGEFLKYLPGITVDYVAADVRTVSVRGFSSQFTNVYLDGMRTTSAVSGNTSRVFEFEQVSINNASRVEVNKVPTPDLPADALGGSVNLISKNAFERPGAEFNYRFYLNANSEDTGLLKKTPGPRPSKRSKVLPGFDFDYSVPLSDKFGLVVTGLNSNQFNEQHRWQNVWNFNQAGATPTNPYVQQWQLQDGPKESHRTSFSIKGDWKIDDQQSLSVMVQNNYYKSFFGNRNVNFNMGTSATPSSSSGDPLTWGPDFTQSATGRGSVTMGSSHRDKLGDTVAGLTKYHFSNADWTVDAGLNAAVSKSWYRALGRGHFSAVNLNMQGESVVRADNIDFPHFDLTVMDSSGNQLDPFVLDNYRVNTLRDDPVNGRATMVGAFVDAERTIDGLSFPLALKVGVATRKEEKDNRRYRNDYTYLGGDGTANTPDDTAAPFIDEVYSGTNPHWGYPGIEWADPYKLASWFDQHPEQFRLNATGAETYRIQNSQLINERVSAAYVQATARLLENKLNVVTGLRYESTRDKGAGPLSNADGLFERAYQASKSYGDVYPSVHVSYNFTDKLVGRFAYARTIGRPDYANIVPSVTINDSTSIPGEGTISVSNTALEPWQGDNFDVSLEYYYGTGGVVSGGAFLKDLTNFWSTSTRTLTPAELADFGLDDSYANYLVTSTYNGGDARISGFEFNFYQNLRAWGDFWRRFSVSANGTHLDLNGEHAADFRGFIEDTGNFSVAYNGAPWGARITWNYRGRQRIPNGLNTTGSQYRWCRRRLRRVLRAAHVRRRQSRLHVLQAREAVLERPEHLQQAPGAAALQRRLAAVFLRLPCRGVRRANHPWPQGNLVVACHGQPRGVTFAEGLTRILSNGLLHSIVMRLVRAHAPAEVATLSTARLREEFLLTGLFAPDTPNLIRWEVDRTIIGGFSPAAGAIALPAPPEMRAASFCERREAGIVNVGGPGSIRVDGIEHRLARHDALYLGRGAKEVVMTSSAREQPARFYLLSYPAHAAYPTRHVPFDSAPGVTLGAGETANARSLHKLIHPGNFPTCQVVMGVTRLQPGSVWNTMPPHTHDRRSEVYLYFDLPADQAAFHFHGERQETRHLVVRDGEAVLSPPWSIHSGAGTCGYSFVWGMGGENQAFADMDPAPISELR